MRFTGCILILGVMLGLAGCDQDSSTPATATPAATESTSNGSTQSTDAAEPQDATDMVHITGRVDRPGAYPLGGLLKSVKDALKAAGTADAPPGALVVILHREGERSERRRVPLSNIMSGKSDPPLRADDQVVVMPPSATIPATGPG